MIPLSDLIRNSAAGYHKYLVKKTRFAITSKKIEQIQWLWLNLTQKYNYSQNCEILNHTEKEALDHLLQNFGYISRLNSYSALETLESKIPWVFKDPAGGVFIPLEIFKMLMREPEIQNKNYLFSLLYRLKLKELKGLASIVGNDLDAQAGISFESNVLDMALVLYIWLSHQQQNIDKKETANEEGKILLLPNSGLAPNDPSLGVMNLSECMTSEPEPLWDFLYSRFPRQQQKISSLFDFMSDGNKSFYRSLGLLFESQNRIFKLFRQGWLIPLFRHNQPRANKVGNLMVISPVEIFTNIQQQDSKRLQTFNGPE